MKRKNISGFTVKIGEYHIEIVTHYYMPVCLAIYKNNNRELVKRIEF